MASAPVPIPDTTPETELIDGRFVQKMSPKRRHQALEQRWVAAISAWSRGRGEALTEWRHQFTVPGGTFASLVPDVAYMSHAVLDALAAAGFQAKIVSGGSTPGAAKTPLVPQTTEIRPGTYVFYDASSMEAKVCVEADCALRVLTTVVSTAVPGQCVIDAGSKTLSSDQTVGTGTFGHVVGREWTVRKLNEEHGYVEIHGPAHVGEKVWVVPSHVCPTVNLHDEVWYGRRGRVEGSWKVAARGKVR